MQNAPTVIAATHPPFMKLKARKNVRERVESILIAAARDGRKRRLFIEFSPSEIKGFLVGAKMTQPQFERHDPFTGALEVARNNGWEIVGLDKKSHKTILSNTEKGKKYLKGTRDYVLMNLRETNWARKIRSADAQDFVLIHPDHVSGLLALTRIPANRVEWVNLPRDPQEQYPRLNNGQIEENKRIRLQERKNRKPDAFEPPSSLRRLKNKTQWKIWRAKNTLGKITKHMRPKRPRFTI